MKCGEPRVKGGRGRKEERESGGRGVREKGGAGARDGTYRVVVVEDATGGRLEEDNAVTEEHILALGVRRYEGEGDGPASVLTQCETGGKEGGG